MDIFEIASRMMKMSDEVWQRHMNPWSVYTRMLTLPMLALAVWSRVWLGWFVLIPVTLILIWTWLNPRIFPKPASIDNWASKGVLGERLFMQRKEVQLNLSLHHRVMHRLTTAISALGGVFMIIGLYQLHLWMTIAGTAVAMLGKLWFVDRMVWLYETHRVRKE